VEQKSANMTGRELEEYSALRATIRERGTARMWVFMAGLGVWGALTLGTAALASLPIFTLIPLLVLAGTFEAVYAIHTGVERVGRYLQVFYEELAERRWEHTAMTFGQSFPGGGPDPLFAAYFWMAAVLNIIPIRFVEPAPYPIEWAVIGLAHVLFAAHVFFSKRRAATQRAVDLERFEKLKAGASPR
jgi:hypothetical protein